MEKDFAVKKVLKRSDGVKYIIIPKGSKIKAGKYVMISEIKSKEVK